MWDIVRILIVHCVDLSYIQLRDDVVVQNAYIYYLNLSQMDCAL